MSMMVVDPPLHKASEDKGEVIRLNQKALVGWVLALAAVNWGLVGVLGVNLVETVLGAGSLLTKVAYGLVGLVGVYKVYLLTTGGKK